MIGRIFARRMASLAHPLPRSSKGLYPVPNNPTYKKLMEKQTFFCANDGKLVWQKTPTDMILYRATLGLVVLGTLWSAVSLRQLAAPPKNG